MDTLVIRVEYVSLALFTLFWFLLDSRPLSAQRSALQVPLVLLGCQDSRCLTIEALFKNNFQKLSCQTCISHILLHKADSASLFALPRVTQVTRVKRGRLAKMERR